MKRRFILYRRKLGGTFYVEDTQTESSTGQVPGPTLFAVLRHFITFATMT